MRTIKRLLCLSVVFCLVVCLTPISAAAEGDTQTDDDGEMDEVLVEEILVVSNLDSNTMQVGNTTQLEATIVPTDASNSTLDWSSNDESCATVDANGFVTALTAGAVTISASATDGSGVFGEIQLNVAAIDQPADTEDEPEENASNDVTNEPSISPDEQLQEKLKQGGEICISDDILLSNDITIPENTQLTLSGKLTIPESLTLTNYGKLVLTNASEIYGILENCATGIIEFAPSDHEMPMTVFSSADHPQGVLLNAGIINLHGKLVLESPECFTVDQVPIVVFAGGSLVGSDNFTLAANDLSNDESLNDAAVILLSEYIKSSTGSQTLELSGDILIDQSFTIEPGEIVRITEGTTSIAPNITLVNAGYLEISGGTLIVQDGAVLDNKCYICVNGNGLMNVSEQGNYQDSQDSVLLLDQATAGGSAAITGIDESKTEYSVLAGSISQLKDWLKVEGYRFLTIFVNNSNMLNKADITIPANKSISILP